MDSENNLLESKLSKDLQKCLENIKISSEEMWETPQHSHYTNHDIKHSKRIITKLNKMLGDKNNSININEHESFILLSAAYLHDIGMQTDEVIRNNSKPIYTYEEMESIRKLHNESSVKLIYDGNYLVSEICEQYIDSIATVVKFHSGNTDITQIKDSPIDDDCIRLKFLSALFKLADELDRDYRRSNVQKIKHWDIPVESKFHWFINYYTQSVLIENGKIKLFFKFPEECKERYKDLFEKVFVEQTIASIKKQLFESISIIWDHDVKLLLDESNIRIEYSKKKECIDEELHNYIKENYLNTTRSIEKSDFKTSIDWYVDGAVYSDDPKFSKNIINILKYLKLNKYNKAIEETRKSLNLLITPMERIVLSIIAGNCYYMIGNQESAKNHYKDALQIFENENFKRIYEKEVPKGMSTVLNNLGMVYFDKGELNKALESFEKSIEINQEIGYKKGEAINLSNLGLIYLDKEAINLSNLGLIYLDKGELNKALESFEKSIEINQEIGYKKGEADDLGNMGIIYKKMNNYEEALNYHERALGIDKKIGDRYGEAIDLANLGVIYKKMNKPEKAVTTSQKAFELLEELGDTKYKKEKEEIISNIDSIYSLKGDVLDAFEYKEILLSLQNKKMIEF
ncbi:MAG: tetratricopeptide repeat protein [Methanobacterium sp.]|uniref:tetratricopeptide repeat protein n=1 Tax=Methanobacterium sp. TaxID=2164 RepID=UPI003D65DE5B|nr:tetratricopeptide repeat protein [Methanobacterium sp.]